MRTYSPTPKDIDRKWFVVDAEDKILGRLASAIAIRLRGKHKPEFSPHMDNGDFIVVVNAGRIKVTGRKLDQKMYYRHSGYIGHLKETTLRKKMEKNSREVIVHAVRGMLPKNRLGRALLKKLKVYDGPAHPHTAQRPEQLDI